MSPRLKDFLSRGGCGPCPECEGPHLRCTPLHSPEQVIRLGSCSHLWALRPMPRVTFVSRRKSPKACQEASPLNPHRGTLRSPCGKPHPLDRVSTSNPDRFATLRQVSESVFFLPGVAEGTPSTFKPWRGSAGRLGGRSCSLMRGMGTGNGNKGTNISFSYISISIYIFYK